MTRPEGVETAPATKALATALQVVLPQYLDISPRILTAAEWEDVAHDLVGEHGVKLAEYKPPATTAAQCSYREFAHLNEILGRIVYEAITTGCIPPGLVRDLDMRSPRYDTYFSTSDMIDSINSLNTLKSPIRTTLKAPIITAGGA